jgi:hypothetical protein
MSDDRAPGSLFFPVEPARRRSLFLQLALVVTIAHLGLITSFVVPGGGGTSFEENAFLGGGQNIARHLSLGSHRYAHELSGPNWIRAADGWTYPDCPVGVPLLHAVAIWLGLGHFEATSFTSPMCTALAVLGIFFLVRMIAGSFIGLLASIALSTNTTLLLAALVPGWEAPAVCFSLWGMVALLAWWRSGKTSSAIAAGTLLGFAVGIRYCEATLVLPLVLAVATTLRTRGRGAILASTLPLLVFGLLVLGLLAYSLGVFGHLVGLRTALGGGLEWEPLVANLHLYGLSFLFPLGVLGLLVMGAGSPRLALLVALWLLPPLLLGLAPGGDGVARGASQLRAVLPSFPPLLVSALWLISRAAQPSSPDPSSPDPGSRVAMRAQLFGGALVLAFAVAGLYGSLREIPRFTRRISNLGILSDTLKEWIPELRSPRRSAVERPIVFVDGRGSLSPVFLHLQVVHDGEWVGMFVGGGVSPAFESKLSLMKEAVRTGKGVYVLFKSEEIDPFCSMLGPRGLACWQPRMWTAPFPESPLNEKMRPGPKRIGPGLSPSFREKNADPSLPSLGFAKIDVFR